MGARHQCRNRSKNFVRKTTHFPVEKWGPMNIGNTSTPMRQFLNMTAKSFCIIVQTAILISQSIIGRPQSLGLFLFLLPRYFWFSFLVPLGISTEDWRLIHRGDQAGQAPILMRQNFLRRHTIIVSNERPDSTPESSCGSGTPVPCKKRAPQSMRRYRP